jgi:hypothetical protein
MTPGEDVHLPSLRDGAEEDLLIVVTNPTNTWLGLRKEKVRGFLEIQRTEMGITKNKNPQASLYIFFRFLNPHRSLWIFLCKSQRFGESLETFGSRIFFFRFLKSIGWYEFSCGFWLSNVHLGLLNNFI